MAATKDIVWERCYSAYIVVYIYVYIFLMCTYTYTLFFLCEYIYILVLTEFTKGNGFVVESKLQAPIELWAVKD